MQNTSDYDANIGLQHPTHTSEIHQNHPVSRQKLSGDTNNTRHPITLFPFFGSAQGITNYYTQDGIATSTALLIFGVTTGSQNSPRANSAVLHQNASIIRNRSLSVARSPLTNAAVGVKEDRTKPILYVKS